MSEYEKKYRYAHEWVEKTRDYIPSPRNATMIADYLRKHKLDFTHENLSRAWRLSNLRERF